MLEILVRLSLAPLRLHWVLHSILTCKSEWNIGVLPIFNDFLFENTKDNERNRSMAFIFRLSYVIPDGLIARRFDESDDITIFIQVSADRVHNRSITKVKAPDSPNFNDVAEPELVSTSL